jgi:hypothetical protein
VGLSAVAGLMRVPLWPVAVIWFASSNHKDIGFDGWVIGTTLSALGDLNSTKALFAMTRLPLHRSSLQWVDLSL